MKTVARPSVNNEIIMNLLNKPNRDYLLRDPPKRDIDSIFNDVTKNHIL